MCRSFCAERWRLLPIQQLECVEIILDCLWDKICFVGMSNQLVRVSDTIILDKGHKTTQYAYLIYLPAVLGRGRWRPTRKEALDLPTDTMLPAIIVADVSE